MEQCDGLMGKHVLYDIPSYHGDDVLAMEV